MSNVNIFDNQIKLKDVEELLLLGMNINLPVFMLSGPGRGKSSIVKQFADKYFNGKMQTLILSRIESSDLALPIPTKNDDGTYTYTSYNRAEKGTDYSEIDYWKGANNYGEKQEKVRKHFQETENK